MHLVVPELVEGPLREPQGPQNTNPARKGGIFYEVKMTSKKLSGGLFLAIFFLFVSCVSHPVIEPQDEPLLYPEQTYIPQSFAWQQVHNGIWRFDFKNPEFPVIYHAVKIDLTNAALTPVCFPSKDTPKKIAQKGKKTSRFAKQEGCVVAINTSPFTLKAG